MAPYTTIIGLVVVELHLHGIGSLKEKRSIISSLTSRLQKTFNVSVAEVGYQDLWQSSAIAVAAVTSSRSHADQITNNIIKWIEDNFPDLEIMNEHIEIL